MKDASLAHQIANWVEEIKDPYWYAIGVAELNRATEGAFVELVRAASQRLNQSGASLRQRLDGLACLANSGSDATMAELANEVVTQLRYLHDAQLRTTVLDSLGAAVRFVPKAVAASELRALLEMRSVRRRKELLVTLAAASDLIAYVGGVQAIEKAAAAVAEIAHWWP